MAEAAAENIRRARQCFLARQFDEADRLARDVLQTDPRHADALHLCGAVCIERGDPEQAISLLEQAIAVSPLRPELHMALGGALGQAGRVEPALQSLRKAVQLKSDFAAGHNQLATFLQQQGRMEEAVASFIHAIQCAPRFAPYYSNLGIAYTKMRNEALAIAAFEDALQIDPNFIGALANLGILLKSMNRNAEAVECFERVLAINPAHVATRIALGNLCRLQGNHAGALTHFERALQADPGNAEIRFQIDALRQNNVERPPLAYVRNLFDDFADRFDRKLVEELGYSAPRRLAEAIHAVRGEKSDWRVLDLGCGTGLVGVELKPVAAVLTGIDAAPKMLDKARERGIYDALIEAEMTAFLQAAAAGEFDLICSADVFIYLGNLEPVFAEASRILPHGGLFTFSLEANVTDRQPYRLNVTGRYAQSKEWIESLSAQYGFAVAHFSDCTLRQENKAPVAGYLFVLKRAA